MEHSHILTVIRDKTGKKILEKLFETYTPGGNTDYARFAEWLIAVDKLLSEFGGRALPPEPEEDEEDEGKDGENDESDPDDDYDIEDDLHENAAIKLTEIARVKAAVARVLKG